MASTVGSGTVTVKITETVSLNGSTYDATNILSIPSVNEVSQRIMTLPGQVICEIAEFDSTNNGRGKFVRSDVQYMRITNLDDTNSLAIATKTASSYCWQLVTPGRSWILSSASTSFEGDSIPVVVAPTLANVDMIYARGSSEDVIDMELFIGLT
jgi:hypothetical protein